MRIKYTYPLGFVLFLALLPLQAQIPRTLSYQGIVTDAAGDAKPDGTYRFQFEIYDAETGGNRLWGPQTEDLEVNDGLFHTQLGPFPISVTFDTPYWLGIIVGGEVLSRVALTSVGYSIRASYADTAGYALATAPSESAGGFADTDQAYLADSGWFGTSLTDLVSVTVTVSTGQKVLLMYSCASRSGIDDNYIDFQITRSGGPDFASLRVGFVHWGYQRTAARQYLDSPGSGTFTYTLRANAGASSSGRAEQVQLIAIVG